MADERQFKFVSPGIFINEIDNSQLPGLPAAQGPVIIGRFPRGPSLRPVTVKTFADFVEQFGNPIPGKQGGDVWRDGNKLAPTYASYAAQAWLRNTPNAKIVRVLGRSHADGTTGTPNEAGWKIGSTVGTTAANGGAYGLFVGENTGDAADGDGQWKESVLAATFYLAEGSLELSGTLHDGTVNESAASAAMQNIGANHEFRLLIRNASDTVVEDVVVNFDPNSQKYIRKRLNTNPTLINSKVSTDTKTYFLGETYDRSLLDVCGASSAAADSIGFVLGLVADSSDLAATVQGGSRLRNTQPSRSGWLISQDLSTNESGYVPASMQKLFRFESLDDGEWTQNNLKLSIEDIKKSVRTNDPYGTFTVSLRQIDDQDGAPQYVERYALCTLNPNSPNYIAKKLGDEYYEWSDTTRSWTVRGNYPARSRFIRVKMNADVDDGATDPAYLPFGFIGAPRLIGMTLMDTLATVQSFRDDTDNDTITNVWVKGAEGIMKGRSTPVVSGLSGSNPRINIHYPTHGYVASSKNNSLSDPTKTYFGVDTNQLDVDNVNSTKTFDPSVRDIARALPSAGVDAIYSYAPDGVDAGAGVKVQGNQPVTEATDGLAPAHGGSTAYTEDHKSTCFSLDDLKLDGTTHAAWAHGNRVAGTAISATSGKDWNDVINTYSFDKFTLPLFGGFDGLDITEQEPFRNSSGGNGDQASNPPLDGSTELLSYAFNSLKVAVDSVSDPDVVECNAICAPGITEPGITDHILEVCENRADALAVLDIQSGYVPTTEGTAESMGSVTNTVTSLEGRNLNSSYGCVYYPWVQIQDTVNQAQLWVPPSIVALGVFSSTDRRAELWFAPAGFNRGGLTEGHAGLPVTGVRERLTAKDRDKLYDANVNPIAQFPAEGIVIFGQKTLQSTASALDRINVRRLMIFLKKEISKIAATTLFDQNVAATWNRFKGPTNLLLSSVKSRFGLSNYKLILDDSTTTADLIERNIMYAKILLAPTKAIEFIALDFVITRSGASFAD
jgi:phage tail sheath protein FI